MGESETIRTAAAPEIQAATQEEMTAARKRFILSLVCSSHTLNHIQSGVTSVLFQVMMKELGFGYLQLGILSAAHHFAAQGLQVIYGFLAAFMRRASILGFGNILLGISVLFHSLLGSYNHFLAATVLS